MLQPITYTRESKTGLVSDMHKMVIITLCFVYTTVLTSQITERACPGYIARNTILSLGS